MSFVKFCQTFPYGIFTEANYLDCINITIIIVLFSLLFSFICFYMFLFLPSMSLFIRIIMEAVINDVIFHTRVGVYTLLMPWLLVGLMSWQLTTRAAPASMQQLVMEICKFTKLYDCIMWQ